MYFAALENVATYQLDGHSSPSGTRTARRR